jgi:hypothetical protein
MSSTIEAVGPPGGRGFFLIMESISLTSILFSEGMAGDPLTRATAEIAKHRALGAMVRSSTKLFTN